MALPSPARQKQIVAAAANRYGIKPSVLWGVYGQETRFGALAGATSSAGAQGPFQFMPKTAAGLGIDPHDFKQAAFGAAKYLSQYKGRGTAGMLAAYNAGPAGNPNNPETRKYIPGVLNYAKTWKGGGGTPTAGGTGGGGSSDPLATVTGGASPDRTIGQGSEGLVSLLQSLQEQKQAPASSSLQAPAFSAQAAMPTAYKGLSSSSPPEPKVDLTAAISALQGTGQTIEHPGTPGVSATIGGTPSAGGGGSFPATGGKTGAVRIAPTADRAGVHTNPAVIRFGRRVAGLFGAPLTLGTGTNHSRLTVNGNVSQHWGGNAGDFPLAGRALIRAGQDALIVAGMNPKKARQQTGGLFNVGGAQIIFNTQTGGDHTDHLHIGVNRR